MEQEPPTQADPRFYQLLKAVGLDPKEAARLIATDPTIINARSGLGETALHYLVVENAFEAVEWLRQHGSDIDPVNIFGNTALVEAAGLGYLKMCQYLVNHGANPRHICADPHGTTTSALSNAASSDQIEVLKYLLNLLDTNEDINRYFSDLEIYFAKKNSSRLVEVFNARGLREVKLWE